MASNKYFDCPYCGKRMTKEDMIEHIESLHVDQIPEGYTPLRITFNVVNHRPMDYCGICTECKGPTRWDENKGRYDRQCGKKSCHDSFVRKFEENSRKKLGYARLSENPEGMEKLLASRKISGKYIFKDGGMRTYTGSYEKKALEFMDQVMEIRSEDILTPGPILSYKFNDEDHVYISDMYYAPYDLVIEVKDGGDRPNTRNMPEYRAKQIAKEKHILKNTNYNYLRLTNNDFSQLLAVMMDLKMQLVEKTGRRVVHVNENMFAATAAMMPPANTNNVYVVNYLKNNVFAEEDEPEIMVSGTPTFDTVFYRSVDGTLKRGDRKMLEDCKYDLYMVEDVREKVLEACIGNLGKFVTEGFLYETLFDKKLYTSDQIVIEEKAIRITDIYMANESIAEMVYNSIMHHDGTARKLLEFAMVTTLLEPMKFEESYARINDGHCYVEETLLDGSVLILNLDDPNQKQLHDLLNGGFH